jgi:hypothetical protein
MKKILTLIFTVISLTSFSQSVNRPALDWGAITGDIVPTDSIPFSYNAVRNVIWTKDTAAQLVMGAIAPPEVLGTPIGTRLYVWKSGNIAIGGASDNSAGVSGNSISNYGLYGYSITGGGIYGHSDSLNGVYAQSHGGNGVLGESIDSNGVYGKSVNQYGGYFYGKAKVTDSLIVEKEIITPVITITSTDTASKNGTYTYPVGSIFTRITASDTSLWIKIKLTGPIAARWKKVTLTP